jgi:hypothetical protein
MDKYTLEMVVSPRETVFMRWENRVFFMVHFWFLGCGEI